ncbi:TniQ family protein [Paucibacter sp. KCTC 42545]|uniref:TniQ family protein n=1 Tax=Paucibacter sp. KCTC 42545 TaxID=1768242 RepID=UPI0026829722
MAHGRRHIPFEGAAAFSQLTGVPQAWFEHRLPRWLDRDRWREIELFGQAWRDDWTLRGTHQQVCTLCLSEQGFARAEWDLNAYAACHLHGTILLDHCGYCGRGISPDRPAVDICSCGHYIAAEMMPADSAVVRWSAMCADAVGAGAGICATDLGGLSLLQGLSADGAYRVLLAFGGGQPALRGRVLNSVESWLTSAAMHEVLATAIRRMAEPTGFMWGSRSEVQRCTSSLAEQQLRGVTPFDRTAAGHLRNAMGLPARWRNRRPAFHHQLDLFT